METFFWFVTQSLLQTLAEKKHVTNPQERLRGGL